MSVKELSFPQLPGYGILVSLTSNLQKETVARAKKELISGNEKYDYSFLNTNHVVSLAHLYHAIYKSLLDYVNGTMRAKSLNTEVFLNMSPVNNISDALRRYGLDETVGNVITVKITKTEDIDKTKFELEGFLKEELSDETSKREELTDEVLYDRFVDLKKVKKVYKLNDVKLVEDAREQQKQLSKLVIGACVIRGC